MLKNLVYPLMHGLSALLTVSLNQSIYGSDSNAQAWKNVWY
ncbi:hypothetical protein CEV34_1977 [Brucella pseudogrignonensis]|uniref:Uncharacterized protein n=1 Tax=Brucella pseudogrignonensis TaxID=419475 RepID=A0A256GMU6_9HYPH|nr:hypothetical protein CEV34_1977 [Brucella pseudogrignonensis]